RRPYVAPRTSSRGFRPAHRRKGANRYGSTEARWWIAAPPAGAESALWDKVATRLGAVRISTEGRLVELAQILPRARPRVELVTCVLEGEVGEEVELVERHARLLETSREADARSQLTERVRATLRGRLAAEQGRD